METFVVRVWTPAEPEPGLAVVGLRGLVEHPASGQSIPFSRVSELVAFIDAHLTEGPGNRSALHADQPKTWPRSSKG